MYGDSFPLDKTGTFDTLNETVLSNKLGTSLSGTCEGASLMVPDWLTHDVKPDDVDCGWGDLAGSFSAPSPWLVGADTDCGVGDLAGGFSVPSFFLRGVDHCWRVFCRDDSEDA